VQTPGQPATDSALQQSETRWLFFTRRELASAWRREFAECADAVPQPFWLFAADEKTPIAMGFPVRTTPAWEALCQSLAALVLEDGQPVAAGAVGLGSGPVDRGPLVQKLAAVLENALVSSHGRRYTEILWLALCREASVAIGEAVHRAAPDLGGPTSSSACALRYSLARRVADVLGRAESEAVSRARGWKGPDLRPEALAFGRILRADLMPLAERRLTADLVQLDAWVHGVHGLDADRFRRALHGFIERLERLRQRDGGFVQALRLIDPEAEKLSPEARAFSAPVLDLLAAWPGGDTPRPAPELERLLREAGRVLRRFEVVVALRDRIYPVTVEGTRSSTLLRRRPVALSAFTRPLDFTAPGVVDSAVRRYGLLYDLVEFTALLEALRRQGRAAEERGLRFMAEFNRAIDGIRARRRLKFEKFLGDGAFYSARSALPVLLAACELRTVYEELKTRGFPFDRGLRIAVNVGTYHLLPLVTADAEPPHFEFFGHSLVELARLTTGKTTHEADDIADYLIASGYDVHRVLEFLEPVRSARRRSERLTERSYAAFLEGGELVNLSCVTTEAFLRDLDAELGEARLRAGSWAGSRWLLFPFEPGEPDGPQVALRYLGTARLKGLEPIQTIEAAALAAPPGDAADLTARTSLADTLHEIAGGGDEPEREEQLAAVPIPPELCLASYLENPQVRRWFMGLYDAGRGALVNAFQVPLQTVELRAGDPFEAWLYRRRGELAMLYQGLRRQDAGTTVPLADLKERDGYVACQLASPHRGPG